MAKSKKTLEITQTKTKANRQEIQINDMDYTTSAVRRRPAGFLRT